MKRLHVLVVEDDDTLRELLAEVLRGWGYEAVVVASGARAVELLETQLFDVAVVDIHLPEMDGVELLRHLKRHDPSIEVLMMTGDPTVATAVETLKLGAYDYLTKPLVLEELRHLLDHILERRLLRQEVNALRSRLGEQLRMSELIGVSPAMEAVKGMIVRVAPADSPVLIEGESGTGKELVAAAIHRLSARASGPFITVNCGAVPSDLLESEFFGHVRGAFSGAVADTLGLFRSAHGGTIFLDEVAELPPALQVKLLRVLQEKDVRPVGSTRSYSVDTRVIAATNKNLEAAIKDGSLRQDLFYRLNVVRVHVPPLRERKADVPALVTTFLRQMNQRFNREIKGIAPDAMAALLAYDFPGNVRELENLMERAYALGAREQMTLADLPALGGGTAPPAPRAPAPALAVADAPVPEPVAVAVVAAAGPVPTLAQAERELILRALEIHRNDRAKAARALGLSSRTLYRRLKEYGIS
jgi:DNA-binding NtrC family response regulator